MAWTVDVDLPAGGIVEYKFAAATQKGRGMYTRARAHTHTHQHNNTPTHTQHINTPAQPPTHTHTHKHTHTCGDEALVIAEVLDLRIPSISLSPPQPFHIGNCYLPGKLFLIRVFRPSLCPHHNHFILLLLSSSSSSWTVKSCCLRI